MPSDGLTLSTGAQFGAQTNDPSSSVIQRRRIDPVSASGDGELGSRVQRAAVDATRPFEDLFGKFRSSFARDVADTTQEQNRLGSGLSSVVASKFKRVGGRPGGGGNLSQLERKAKARQQISGRGEKAILNQQLKDRIGIARQNISRRQLSIDAAGASASARIGLNTSLQRSKDQVGSAIGGAIGSVAGGLASGLSNRKFGTTVDAITDQGTFGADQILNQSGPGSVNFNFDPQVDPGSQIFTEQYA